MHNLPSGEHKTACFFNDQAKTVTVWLGSSDSLPVFIRHFNFVFHSFWSLQNPFNEKNFFPGRLYKAPGTSEFFAQKK